jgi:UDP-N-acetylglucosamine 4,6-dehydratase
MTRFMMTLDDAVDLVLYAFKHGNNGDIFVQKAPAATVQVLTQAILELMGKPGSRGARDWHPPWRKAV